MMSFESLEHIAEELRDIIWDVGPIIIILVVFQFAVLRKRVPNMGRVVVGFAYVILGMTLFLVGLEEALFPLGEAMAAQLTAPAFLGVDLATAVWSDFMWVYIFAAAIGFAATIAEPALIAVAYKADEISGGTISAMGLRISVALGVSVGVSLGTFRIVTGGPLPLFIGIGYVVVVLMTLLAAKSIIPLAYDSGGVTTSTVTVPIVTALGLGLATAIPGRSPLIDGFGLIAFACLFPIISVMGYAVLTTWLRQKKRSQSEQEETNHAVETDHGPGEQ